jgi:hypothetical protein
MHIKIFINETSFHSQYKLEDDFSEAVGVFRKILKLISEYQQRFGTISVWINKEAIDDFLEEFLIIVKDEGLKSDIENQIFNKLNANDWKSNPLNKPESKFFYFYWNKNTNKYEVEVSINDTMSEIGERVLAYSEENYLAINFIESKFQGKKYIQIIKGDALDNFSDIVRIDCVENLEGLQEWFENNFKLDSLFQDRNRFEKTKIKAQGQPVFKEIKTGYYWYFDNFHRDFESKEVKKPTEIEVFDSQGKHLGVADLEGKIDFSSKKDDRNINIK